MHALTSLASPGLVSPSPAEVARRVRAAFAYAGLDVSKPVPGLPVDPPTIQWMIDPINPRGAESERELSQIAKATGVPVGFLLCGFMVEGLSHAEHIRTDGNSHNAALRSVADPPDEVSEPLATTASQSGSRGADSPATPARRVSETAVAPASGQRLRRTPRRRRRRWRRRRAWWE